MTVAVLLSIVVGLVGFILLVIALFKQRKYERIRTTPTVPIGSLSAVSPWQGTSCQITGAAEPGPAGPLVGPMSGRPCVWFHAKIVEHWTTTHTTYGTDANGNSTSNTTTNHHQVILREDISPPQIALRDQTGVAVLDFRGTHVDHPFPSFRNRLRPIPGLPMPGGVVVNRRRQSHYVEYTENMVQPGQPVYALGRGGPHPQTGVPALVRPDEGPFIVSTRSQGQVIQGARTTMVVLYVVGGVLFGAATLSFIFFAWIA